MLLLLAIPFAFVGGAIALYLRGMNLNVSSGVGFAAVFGVSIMNGVLIVRTITDLVVKRDGADDARVVVEVAGDGFLYNMVRNIVGTLVDVGRGRLHPDAVPAVLGARDRREAGPAAPPHGLYLVQVDYPPPFRWEH